MKLVTATLATAILLALAGVAPPAHAQDQQQQDKTHPTKPAHPQQQQKPAHSQEQKPAHPQQKPAQPARQQQHQQQQAQHQQQQEQKPQQRAQQAQQRQQKVQKTQRKEEQRQQNASRPQPTRTQRAQQAPPERGGQPARGNPQQTAHYEQAHFRRYTPQRGERVVRIPDPQFREHFGRDHRFSIGAPVIVGGFPRFQYGGFWFVIEEPWPGYWTYGSPDYYILFTDGNYWLCDYDDPGVQIELTVIVA